MGTTVKTQYSLSQSILLSLVLVLLGSCLLSGCGGFNPEKMLADACDNNVKRLSRMYTVFQMRNSMIGPSDESEFKKFILQHSSVRLARIGIEREKIDDIFYSERDGQKLVVRYGVQLEGPEKSIPVVFEVEGSGGKRFVGFSNAYAIEVSDDDQYDRLISGKEDNKVIDEYLGDTPRVIDEEY